MSPIFFSSAPANQILCNNYIFIDTKDLNCLHLTLILAVPPFYFKLKINLTKNTQRKQLQKQN